MSATVMIIEKEAKSGVGEVLRSTGISHRGSKKELSVSGILGPVPQLAS